METLIINIPEKKSELVKQLLKELGVKISQTSVGVGESIPNALTAKTIREAKKGNGLSEPIENIQEFVNNSKANGVPINFSKNPDVMALAGIWKNRDITLEQLRKEAWGERI